MVAYSIPVLVILICVAIGAIRLAWPAHGMHELMRGEEPPVYSATLAPLPAPVEPWEPRSVPDVQPQVRELTAALSAVRHPSYQYAARLAAMSWQSHRTLQRTYDMLAFATVVTALQRHEVSYA